MRLGLHTTKYNYHRKNLCELRVLRGEKDVVSEETGDSRSLTLVVIDKDYDHDNNLEIFNLKSAIKDQKLL